MDAKVFTTGHEHTAPIASFRRLMGNPLFGDDHEPLELTGDDLSLVPLADALRPHLCPEPTDEMLLAIAACARCLVLAYRRGHRVHYSRAKNTYDIPKRYRQSRFHSHHFITQAMDALLNSGLIGHELGYRVLHGAGRQSVSWPAPALLTLLDGLVYSNVPQKPSGSPESVILRDRADKKLIDYDNTPMSVRMRQQLEIINPHLMALQIYYRGVQMPPPFLRRIFNGDFTRGGRLYCQGASFQNLPADERRFLSMKLDGELAPLAEVDYCNLHILMAYSAVGKTAPQGDQYSIGGFDRGLVKIATNIMINAGTPAAAIKAISHELVTNPRLRRASGLLDPDKTFCRNLAKRVAMAVQTKHEAISTVFSSDSGAQFQKIDSDMAVQIMLRFIKKTGTAPLPLHDSFLVPRPYLWALIRIMRQEAEKQGLHIPLKVNLPNSTWTAHLFPDPSSSPLEGTGAELHKLSNQYRLQEVGSTAPECAETHFGCVVRAPPGRDPPRAAQWVSICPQRGQ